MSLKEIRNQRNWSQEDLAEASGLSVRTIQRLERGHSAGAESLKSLAAAFDMDVADLREGLKAAKNGEADTHTDTDAETHADNVIGFCVMSVVLLILLVFTFLSALQDGSNWGGFGMMAFCSLLILAALAWSTFGTSWRNRIISRHQSR